VLTTLLAAVIVLGPVIVFHEFGHFIVAKLAGIYVKTFSLGFGPKLLRFRWGETEYCLSALPLGGYVRMAGESNEEPAADANAAPDATAPAPALARPTGEAALYPRDGLADADIPRHRWLRSKPIPTRLAVVTAGPFANLVLAVVVMTAVLYHEGLSVPPTTTLGDFAADSDEARAGLRGGDRVLAIAGQAVGNPLEIKQRLDTLADGPFDLTLNRAGRDTTLTFSGVRRAQGDIVFPIWSYRPDARIGLVKKEGPADRAGLQAGDRIVAVDGNPVQYYDQLAERINPAIGKPLQIQWERDGKLLEATVTPEADEVPVGDSLTKVQKIGRIQIEPYNLVVPVSFGRAFQESLARTGGFIRDTLRFLWMLVRGEGSRDAVGGPIRIGQVAGSALRWGYSMLLYFMAFFSVNLFLLNMLPIPVLDGGHVLFLTIEAVRGEALSLRVQEWALRVGLSALIALMGYVVLMDLWRVLGR
jgi:regulator of sigma E protease